MSPSGSNRRPADFATMAGSAGPRQGGLTRFASFIRPRIGGRRRRTHNEAAASTVATEDQSDAHEIRAEIASSTARGRGA